MVLTPNQIEEVLRIISYHQVRFLAENVGIEQLTSSDLDTLRDFGIDPSVYPTTGTLDDAFKFGVLSTALSDAKLNKLSYEQFKGFLKEGKGIPLSKEERFALKNIKRRGYSDIKGLGNKISQDFQTMLIESSQKQRKEYEKIIKDTAAQNVISRGSVKDLVSELGHKTNDWTRDLGRISDFIHHDAFDNGRAENIRTNFGDKAEVYKEVYPSACQHCIKLYLTAGAGSEPIIFSVLELIQNGTNIGRKTVDWKPVVGCTHPWCRCTLRRKPEGYKWDPETQSFSIPTGERKVQRKSKIKIISGDKEYFV